MHLDILLEVLQEALNCPLPGRESHLRMSPLPIDVRRFTTPLPQAHKKSAVLILFYPREQGVFFPLIKRPSYPGIHSDQVGFPGGKVEPEDPDVTFTALREAQEEIGIDASKVVVLGSLSDLYIPSSSFLVTPVLGFMTETPRFVPDEREVSRIIPTQLTSLFQQELKKHTQLQVGKGLELYTPYFDISGEVVWGATAMILSELIDLLDQKRMP